MRTDDIETGYHTYANIRYLLGLISGQAEKLARGKRYRTTRQEATQKDTHEQCALDVDNRILR